MRIAIFPTCVVDTVAGRVGAAVARVLRRQGHEVELLEGATCCGQPAWNAGYVRQAAAVARATLRAVERTDADIVCVPAGSCTTMVRVYWRELFQVVEDQPAAELAGTVAHSVREFSELVATGPVPRVADGDRTVAYHHSCHMLRELGLATEPEAVLQRAGVSIGPWPAAERCCGFGGTFAVKQPETSVAMADDKLDRLGPCAELVGCDASCLLHLGARAERRGIPLRVRHLAEVLDDADTLP